MSAACKIRRYGDEYQCHHCGLAWAVGEEMQCPKMAFLEWRRTFEAHAAEQFNLPLAQIAIDWCDGRGRYRADLLQAAWEGFKMALKEGNAHAV